MRKTCQVPLGKFEILEHRADLKIRAFGSDKKELFKNALLGMQSGLRAEIREKEPSIKRKIKISSADLNSLLVDFLAEVNYLNDVEKEVYEGVKFLGFSENQLEAEILGRKIKRFGLQIKGVTYHQLDVHQTKDGIWEAVVLFDI